MTEETFLSSSGFSGVQLFDLASGRHHCETWATLMIMAAILCVVAGSER